MPKVSIVMPVYNGEQYIRESIESIINQTFSDWEFLIINEYGSNQDVTAILHEYARKDHRIKVIQNNVRLKIAASMNVGIDMASGEYIARMDSDDISMPNRFEKQVAYMDAHPEIGLLGIKPEIFGEENWEWNAENNPAQVKSDSLFYLPCLHPTVMMRKSVLDQYELRYNPEYYCTEDYDLFERLLQVTKASNLLDKDLFKYRRYATAATYAHGNKGDEIYKIVMNRAFKRLGLQFSNEELQLLYIHEGLNGLMGVDVEKALIQLDLLLKKIFFANETKKIYEKNFLFRTLHKRYQEAYETLSWKCKKYNIDNAQIWYGKSIFSNTNFYESKNKAYTPTVSVIMPTYNSEDYVADTIWSVLKQTYYDFELLVLNEYGSNDNTVCIAESFGDPRIKVIQNDTKLGLAESLNLGFRIANGKYLARVDADDLYSNDRFEKQVRFLDENPEYGVCGTWQHHFGIGIDYNHCPSISHDDLKAEFIFNCELCHSTVMLRKDAFIENNLFYDSSKQAEDYELWTRAIQYVKFTNIPEVLGEYRIGDNNITAGKIDKLQQESGEIAAAIIKRDFGIEISPGHICYMGGWKNEFAHNEDSSLRKRLITEENQILNAMLEKNRKLNNYNQESLERTVKRRKEWMTPTNPINAVKIIKKRKVSYKVLIRKTIKKILRPCAKVRNLFLKPVRQQLWDLNGHLSDVDGHMWDYYERTEQLINLQNEKINELERKVMMLETELSSSLHATVQTAVHNEISNAEDRTNKLLATKEVQIEDIITKAIDTRMCESEKFINQTMDARVWEAEKTINQTMDSRIWEAEKNINQTMDTRVWKSEKLLEETIYSTGKQVRGEIWNTLFYTNKDFFSSTGKKNSLYNSMFYDDNRFESYLSAYHVLRKLLPEIKPKSVCDFGCGTGTWLSVASKLGVVDILGFDGDYVEKSWLMIPEEKFISADLSKPLQLNRKFDMAMSLEVAEHIAENDADVFIDNLCQASDLILFSAAHPGQGGEGHLNEQPQEYWEQKFNVRGFSKIEVAEKFKENREICWWYRDNICIFKKQP